MPDMPTAEIVEAGHHQLWPSGETIRVFHLRVTESTGPLEDYAGRDAGAPCPGCDRIPEQGDQIVRFDAQWWHLKCTAERMRAGGADAAWLMLAADLAARPSRYSVTQTRAIVRAVLAIAARDRS